MVILSDHPLFDLHFSVVKTVNDFSHHFDLWLKSPGCPISEKDAKLLECFALYPDIQIAARRLKLSPGYTFKRLHTVVKLLHDNRPCYLRWLLGVVYENARAKGFHVEKPRALIIGTENTGAGRLSNAKKK